MAVLLLSTDVEEVEGVCDRAIVMRSGQVVGEFEGRDVTQERLLQAATGVGPEEAA